MRPMKLCIFQTLEQKVSLGLNVYVSINLTSHLGSNLCIQDKRLRAF